ncbi:hypothetical protein Taro_006707 [Colocasia esculenta]|uniref:AP-3 complex subunit delta n=1 Tax=Colocasia esculenta TaxID=4460 RepID=A0A843TW33_COLES|nr:hypothetical protein [Colocasia esculenta]
MAMAGTSSSPSPSSGPSLMDSLFQRTLDDLIKSLRSATGGAGDPPSLVLSRAVDEARREIRSQDPATKAIALQKLTYLSSLHGADISWAAFHPLELLPSPLLLHKKLAYLAASLSFSPSTSVLPLATHQLRKDLASPSDPVTALALSFLASPAASPDLARDLSNELCPLLSSTRPRIRAKATAAALRFFILYPDCVRVAFKRLVENLEYADQRVVSAAVGVFCELSAVDPGPYLPLAPEFYRILVDCRSNWILIKVIKIFSRLAPLEPRLARRIVDPVCEHMRRSSAKSLVFECIRIVFTSLDGFDSAVKLAVDKVREFLASGDDPNLRYLGLKGLSMLRPMHSWAVEESREIVVKSLGDADPNIQREALHLVMGMVSEANLVEISILLVNYALKSDPDFCNEILGEILSTCCRNFYEMVVDFDWYVSLLGDMSRNPHCAQGEEIERQVVDIGMRVRDARPELVRVARDLLINPAFLGNPFLCRILSAAAWVSGEYVEFSRNPVELVEALLQPRTSLLPVSVRAVYIQSVFKVLIFYLGSYFEQEEADHYLPACHQVGSQLTEISDGVSFEVSSNRNPGEKDSVENEDDVSNAPRACSSNELTEMKGSFTYDAVKYILNLIETSLDPFLEDNEVELQERARNVLGFVHTLQEAQGSSLDEESFKKNPKIIQCVTFMVDAFSDELGPTPANAQERVLVPDGVVLKGDLSDLATVLDFEDFEPPRSLIFSLRSHEPCESKENLSSLNESTSLLAEHRRQHGLYYLPTGKDEAEPDGYPRANEPQLPVSHSNATDDSINDILQLTKQSLVPRKTKPRPVVVKLDEGELILASSLKSEELKDDLLSGAVRDVLLGNDDEPTTSRRKTSEKSSRSRDRGTPECADHRNQSNEILDDTQHVNPSSRIRHKSHGKGKVRSTDENVDKGDGKSHKGSHRSSRHRRHKHKEKAGASANVAPQAPAIQDFLL